MNEFYNDMMLLGMKPFTLLHRLGVNGKQSGSLAAIQEIPHAVTVMYGPRGCGFHYRNTVRVRCGPVANLECAGLADQDVIFGGEKKLRTVLQEIDREKHPEMIFILPTVVSDVINDDIYGIAQDMQPDIRAKLVVVQSQAFSHMDKFNSRRNLKELAGQNCRQKFSGADYRGCGYVEVMNALVEQVMEPQERDLLAINVETFIWGYGGTKKLERMKALLARMGIRVNAFLPAAGLEQIRQAPKASLNLVRRKKWALDMEERFGTPYLHISVMSQWHGLDGLRELYETMGEKLGVLPQVKAILDAEEKRIRSKLAEAQARFADRRFCVITNSFSNLPDVIRCYQHDLGIPLRHILLIRNPNFRRDFAVDDAMMERLNQRIRDAMELYGCEAELTVDPDEEGLQKVIADSEFLICGGNPRYAYFGKPVIPGFLDRNVFDYDSFAEVVADHAAWLDKVGMPSGLLLNRMAYDPVFYPLRQDDVNTQASKEMYSRMWRLRKR
ncbi:MAG: hypothetical protein IJ657_02230 [Acidaminococcaceae bacterium]|nr:hypothetical protein [Acidaminococcaceae bacterium]